MDTAKYKKCITVEIVARVLVTAPTIRRTTMATVRHYVEYLHNVIMSRPTSIREIPERNANKVEIPDNYPCFGFRFFDKTEAVVDGKTLTGEMENVSGWYYFGERVTLEELKALPDNQRRLHEAKIRTMERHGITAAVKTKLGGVFVMLDEDDTVI